MGKSSPQVPAAPNPQAVSNAQTSSNLATASAQSALNNVNQVTPYGSNTFNVTGSYTDPTTGASVPQYTETTALSPLAQQIFNQEQGIATNVLGTVANQVPNLDVGGINTSALPSIPAPSAPGAAYIAPQPVSPLSPVTGQAVSPGAPVTPNNISPNSAVAPNNIFPLATVGTNNISALSPVAASTDFGTPQTVNVQNMGAAATNAAYGEAASFLNPQWNQQQKDLEDQLSRQGISVGSDAYNNAMAQFSNAKTQAYNAAAESAITQGANIGAEQAGLGISQNANVFNEALAGQNSIFGQNLAANQNLFGQEATAANQNFGQALAANENTFGQEATAANQNFNQALAGNNSVFNQQATAANQNFGQTLAANQNAFNQANAASTTNFGEALAGNQNMFGQDISASQNNYGQAAQSEQQLFDQALAGNQNVFNQAVTGQQQGTAEQVTAENQPINLLTQLLGGVPSLPTQTQVNPAQTSVNPTDVIGANALSTNAAMQAYQAKLAQQNAMFGGLASLGGSGLMALAMSDAALKENVETVRYDDAGRRWVRFNYIWDDPSIVRIGVIANEVEASDPGAVIAGPFGFKMVDYTKLRDAA